MSEDPGERTERYVRFLESVLPSVDFLAVVHLDAERIERARATVESYLNDAKYYLQNNKPTTALASVAYAEGVIDCLSILGIVNIPGGRFSA